MLRIRSSVVRFRIRSSIVRFRIRFDFGANPDPWIRCLFSLKIKICYLPKFFSLISYVDQPGPTNHGKVTFILILELDNFLLK